MAVVARLLVLLAAAGIGRAGPGPPDPPALRFRHALYNVSVQENSPPKTYAAQPPDEEPLGVRLPTPDVVVRFRVRSGDDDRFFKAEERTVGDFAFLWIRIRAGHAAVLNRERRDSYRLRVRAVASQPGGETLEAETEVLLTVTDANDLSPLFYPAEYDVEVPEDAPAHSSVARVTAEDADLGLAGEVYYGLAEPSDQFTVHLTSGVVTLARRLVLAEASRHELTVLARDRASLATASTSATVSRARLTVRVRAINQHAPEISILRLPARESNVGAETVAWVSTTDRDKGEAGRVIALEVVAGDPDGHFRVRSEADERWTVVAHELLPRSSRSGGYNLTLRARDAGTPSRESYATLAVPAADGDDTAPVFARELYEASVPETAPPDTPVVRLKVTEAMVDDDARVYIEIVGGNEGGEFVINPDTGVLYTARELDAESKARYTLTVSAVDRGAGGRRKQSSAKLVVTVLDANDNDPVFDDDNLDVTIDENAPAGLEVARLTARDADSGENAYVSYAIANLRPVPFEVDHFSGVVRTSRLLDYESQRREYVLRVRASDWGQPYRRQAEARLVVRVRDVNDNRPQFERADCAGPLARRTPPGAALLTLSALDPDAGGVVTYRMLAGNDDGCFALDAATGVLTLACELGVQDEPRVLNVTATDGTHFADPTTVTLRPAGAPGPMECRDTGAARRLTELLLAAERANAEPDPTDDFPATPTRYGLNAHAPEFVDFPVEVKVNESVALGTRLVKLRARDRDLGYNGLLAFAISGGDPDSAFRIDPETGELEVIGHLDRERQDEYFLNVTAYDLGRPRRAASRVLPVTVLDVNDHAPSFERAAASVAVSELAPVGTLIFSARARDPDSGAFGRVSYHVEGAVEFGVNADGSVLVVGALDRERTALYELVVVAEDGGGRKARAALRVVVEDANDNAPVFPAAASARVREDAPIGSPVAALEAEDADSGAGGTVRYRLAAPEEDAAFTIDAVSGIVHTAAPLDFERRQVYAVVVVAEDGGTPSLSGNITLLVEVLDVDENLHAPAFGARVLEAQVRENLPPGAKVARVHATDRDGDALTYRLAGAGLGLFSVDDAGDVRTLTTLDREHEPYHWLTVCAEDLAPAPKHSCVPLLVTVADDNDMRPWTELPAYDVRLPEDSPAGTLVAAIRATDDDLDATLSYRIVGGNPDGLFALDEATGELRTTGRVLDRETTDSLGLDVRVSDGVHACPVRVSVTLADVNDNAPRFLDKFISLKVPAASALAASEEDNEIGDEDEEASANDDALWEESDAAPTSTELFAGSILALDADAGFNGTVRYATRSGRRAVRVHATSGRLYARTPLASYRELAVRACDAGTPRRCSMARVSLAPAPRTAPDPRWRLTAPAPLTVAELDPPGFLLAVLHPDRAPPLYYDIVDGDPQNEFYVGRENGNLLLAKRVTWERRSEYVLNVSATDGARTEYAAVRVAVVNDAHEEGVRFEKDLYRLVVPDGAAPGFIIGKLEARGPPGLRYGVVASRCAALPPLELDETTAELRLTAPLSAPAEHELTVWARDQAPRAGRGYTRVRVSIPGAEERAPSWGRRLATARVPRGAGAGWLVLRARAAGAVTYALADADGGPFFAHPSLGTVTLTGPPPRGPGAPRAYTLLLRAVGSRGTAAVLPVHVTLVDDDSEPPAFLDDDIVAVVAEGLPAGQLVARLEARGVAPLTYSLEDESGAFVMNPLGGVLRTARALDHETAPEHVLAVRACGPSACATAGVRVRVLDVNEHPPRLTQQFYEGEVSESASIGAAVRAVGGGPLVLTATDDDSTAQRRRRYLLPDEAARKFAVDDVTGAITIIQALDYEDKPEHNFTVQVMDGGSPPLAGYSSARVTVRVRDVNDVAPKFPRARYDITLQRPLVVGQLVLNVTAHDPDRPRGTLVYTLDGGEGAFRIHGDGGVLLARTDLPPDPTRLTLRASDGDLVGTTDIAVRTAPVEASGLVFRQSEYRATAVENSTRPVTVAVLDVLGAELGEHVAFSLPAPTEHFEIGATSGAVRTTGVPLDRERTATHELVVEATSGRRIARAVLVVVIADVNDNCPVFVGLPYSGAVVAGAPPGTRVLSVRAKDDDAGDNGAVRYEMKRGHGELFRVDRRTGAVSLRRAARAGRHRLLLAAYDGGAPACGAEAEVLVRVWSGGASPAWGGALHSAEVREDVDVGGAVLTLSATSPLQRPLLYSLVEQDTPDLFYLHYETGELRIREPLDYERARTHALVVRAVDAVSGASADLDVAITVLDVNDCPPRFPDEDLHAAVSEDAAVGTSVLALHATDADSGERGLVSYRVLREDGMDGNDLFTIDEKGVLRVGSKLDRERDVEHRVFIIAVDGGKPALSATAVVVVNVLDVNDCVPTAPVELVAAVSPAARRGTPVARITAYDRDELDAENLRYWTQENTPGARAFSVNETTGEIVLREPRVWAAVEGPVRFNVTVTDGAHKTTTRVIIEPAPIDAHAPRFERQLYEARVAENEPPRVIATVRADDKDAGTFGAVKYSIPADALLEVFALDASTGELRTRVPLDRESRAEWLVPVLATDGGARLAQAAVRVRVSDEDDNAPRFMLTAWRAAVSADLAAGSRVLTVLAEDDDERAELTYSLEPAEEGGEASLAMDSRSGVVSLSRAARAVAGRLLSAWAVVRDGAGHSSRAAVSVRVLPAGVPAPAAPPSPPPVYFMPERAAVGSPVASLAGAAGARYELSGGEDGPFALGEGGALVLAAPLDRETKPTHHVGVEVTMGGAAVTWELRVHVLDDNDHAPRFLSPEYHLTAAEDTPPHSTLLQVMAEDLDAGSNGEVRYSLEDEAGPLAVDAAGGWVTLRVALDRETTASHRAVLRATDGGSPARTATAALLLRVRDVNDNPPKLPRDRSVAVPEDAATGSVLLALVASDSDAEPVPLRYYVVGGDPRGLFTVTNAGELSLHGALDRETNAEHALSVLVTDGTFADSADVRVTVLDVDDNPPLCPRQLYEVTLREDAAVGASVVTLRVTDRDLPENARVSWRLLGQSSDLLAVTDDGRVTVASPLDRETYANLKLRAVALDPARPNRNCSCDLIVTLIDVNDNAPRFSSPHYHLTLLEDAEPGGLAGKLHATDADLGAAGRVKYALQDAADALSIDADSGVLTLRMRLDRETTAEYTWTATATDGGNPPREATALVTLTVADVNDNPPEFEFRKYSVSVPELDAVGTELLRVRALSRDAGVNADVYYSIEDDDGAFELGRLSGVLTLARPLDYERARRHRLTIKAVDGGTPPLSDTASIDIVVIDGNDNVPTFSRASYAVRAREDAPVGSLIADVVATDADDGANGRVTYAIVHGNEDELFAVDAAGRVTIAAPLDRERRALHVLTVRARDSGSPALESAVEVRIDVEDANDNAPRFSATSYDVALQEDRAPGHALLELVVTDADADPNAGPFTFDFHAGDDTSAFRLESDGTLRTAARFNRRARDRYDLVVRVFDNGTPPLFADAAVIVRVVERSRHAPAVTPLDVLVVSYLDSFPGGVIGRVHAADRDPYDRLTFALMATDDAPGAELFEIDSADGTLTVAPRPEAGEYILNATATDGRLVGSALVRIVIQEVTDEALADAVGARLREVTAADFVRDHRAGFCRGVAAAVGVRPESVILLSVQAAGSRRKRQVARDLDVLFAVRATGGGYVAADTVRRALHERLSAVEQSARLVVERLARADCAGCSRGQCRERASLLPGAELSVGTSAAVAAPAHRLEAVCSGTGPVAELRGQGRLVYSLAAGVEDELSLSLSVRTLARSGELARVGGRVEHLVLELSEGRALGRLQVGAGEARALAGFIADGAWHEVRLERRGAALSVRAGRHSAHAVAPAPARVLDASPSLIVGAGLAGCVRGLRLGTGPALPVSEGSRAGGARLVRAESVTWTARCPEPPLPDACSSLPCLNGGTCNLMADGGVACSCVGRFLGERCELDPDPCAARPCLHGGRCRARAGIVRCECPRGLVGDRCERGRWCPGACRGEHCEDHEAGPVCRPRDACAAEPCRAGATCVPDAGGARCVCPADATGADCGEPLTDAVQVAPAPAWERALRWAGAAGWPLWAGIAGALLLLSAVACILRAVCRPRAHPAGPAPPPPKRPNAPHVPKQSNLGKPAPLNNLDTLRSYGSAADELEAMPPDYRRNLNVEPPDHKPWSEQMHLHTFTDNKIYNDLKKGGGMVGGCGARGEDARLVGGYHWDCSDWCAGAAPALLELPHSERRSSTSAPDDDDARYAVHPDAYLPRETDAASLITLEERRSLLRPGSRGSDALCEIEDSDEDEADADEADSGPTADPDGRHTDV